MSLKILIYQPKDFQKKSKNLSLKEQKIINLINLNNLIHFLADKLKYIQRKDDFLLVKYLRQDIIKKKLLWNNI